MNFKNEMDKGVAGAIANTENSNIISRTVEDAAGIAFGLAVAQGVNDKGCRIATTGDTDFVGVTVLDRTATDLINGKFVQYESARILEEGVIWVEVTADVKAGDAAAVDLATGKFNKAGAAMAGARFETSAASGGLAQLRLK
ncbi:hypothetical protein [Psychrobacter sp. JB193]|uniref:structural cement protein Gp24 n=1 Tax=Psychrobacter sp. JB193 TaxID=2024406 RepID=UPI000BAAA891|nr:hypothetical protein [Psychrobacter sp. JB193]PAT63937.1 hypothetical protein CIK80_02160 [Psychrobacter sp. JB193]